MGWWEVPANKWALWEDRMGIAEIIRGMMIPWDSEISVVEIYNLIIDYCKKVRKVPRHFQWAVSERGMLTCDGNIIARVAPLPDKFKPFGADPAADYWEGRILDRQLQWDGEW